MEHLHESHLGLPRARRHAYRDAALEGDAETLIRRHRIPRQDWKAVWFLVETAEFLHRQGEFPALIGSVAPICAIGFRAEDDQYEALMNDAWDTKFWWVQTEVLYATLLAGHGHGNSEARSWAEHLWKYT